MVWNVSGPRAVKKKSIALGKEGENIVGDEGNV